MRIWGVLLLLASTRCGPGAEPAPPDAGEPDAGGIDAAPPFEPDPPAPPAPPAPPSLEPCPAGWRAVAEPDDPDIVTCDPWPAGGPVDCGAGEVHWPGGAGCEPVGPACPDGDWADDLPVGASILWVRAGEPAGGDGSAERPFGSITLALREATEGDVVALSKGTFDEAISAPAGVVLWGACAAETILAPGAGHDELAALTFGERGASARNLTIRGPLIGVFVLARDTEIHFVTVAESSSDGVVVVGAGGLRAFDLVVRASGVAGAFTGGVVAVDGGEIEVERGSVERSGDYGIFLQGGSVVARDLAVRDTGGEGEGIFALARSFVSLERAAFDRNRRSAIIVGDGGTQLVATDVWIRDTALTALGVRGYGLEVGDGASAEISRATLVQNRESAITAYGAFTALAVTDVVVTDTQPWERGIGGRGILVADGAFGTVSRVALLRNHEGGLVAAAAEIVATDVIVRDTRSTISLPGYPPVGDGVVLYPRARMEITRAESSRNDRVGVMVTGLGAELTATDLGVRDGGLALDSCEVGEGLVVQHGGRAAVTRVLVERNQTAGVDVRGFPSELTGSDVAVHDTRSRSSDGQFGVGLWVIDGGTLELTRVTCEDSRYFGILASQEGSLAQLEDLLVAGVDVQGCMPNTCPEAGGGVGIAGTEDGILEATRFLQRESALCGVQVAGGTVDLHEGEVRGNPIGANVQTEGYDLARLEDHVRYFDNDRNLDSRTLPLPDLSDVPVLVEAPP